MSITPLPTPPRPRPIETGPVDGGGRLVPPHWLAHAPVTRALLALNIAVFVVQLIITGGGSLMHLPTPEALAFGASYSLATVGENRWETLVTACFLHDGLLHVGFNMLALWQAGPLVERAVGSARMAPMYLIAGAAGNALSVAYTWLSRTSQVTIGASGAISGVLAAALVVGWRVQGWRGPLTQAMARWLALIIVFGVFSNLSGGNIANTAHVGGALAGGAIAATWRRGYRYSNRAASAILALCASVVVACIAAVVVRDRTDPFATMALKERSDFTSQALADGRCRDAYEGLLAVERLRAKLAPVTPLRNQVLILCGRDP
ncbi:MAG: rhomboid family intramembrane serine protease [Myxococcota bacterium]|nr:rhomboid family intramembrane serine protease [Myxococcota bacterium]